MKLIVGLGNPGRAYAETRHNIGFMVIMALAKTYRITVKRDGSTVSFSGKGAIDGSDVVLAMPLTYMNLSGAAVKSLLRKYKIDLGNLLVICDDLDLDFGRLKIRPKGSSGGHRGLNSIIDTLGTRDFCRLRIGIGRPAQDSADAVDYVLSPFARFERSRLQEVIAEAHDCCGCWIEKGVEEAMNVFNRRS